MPFERPMGQYADMGDLNVEMPELDIEMDDEGYDPESLSFAIGEDGEVTGLAGILEEDTVSAEVPWDANLAEHLEENYLTSLAGELIEAYNADVLSRSPWEEPYKKGLELLGLNIDDRTEPWDGASGVFHPLLAEALVRYVSEAILETFPPSGPAETNIVGSESPEVVKRAARVRQEMNYQCTKGMPEDRAELELTLWRQALAGCAFRKVFFDPVLKRPRRIMVPAEDLVVQYGASDLWGSSRYTYVFNERVNETRKKIEFGVYRDYTPFPSLPSTSDIKERHDEIAGQERVYFDNDELEMLEMYVDLDIEGFEHIGADGMESGVALPYIVTIDKTTGTVVSIYRNHTQDKPYLKRRTYFVPWKYLPGFGIYGTGLCQLLGGSADSATSILRQLIDAGTLSNIPAGFKSRALRIKGDNAPLAPGELRDVDLPPGMVRNSIEWLPTKDPSAVFVSLLQGIVDEGRRLGSVSDMKIGDSSQGAPVGTTLALIERQMRVMSAVQARNNTSMAEELCMLQDIIANEMGDTYDYAMDEPASRRQDFLSTNIIPVADPSATTMSQRIMRYTAAEQLASRQPHLYDMARLHRQMIESMQIPNADKIVPLQDDFVPQDPVTENMRVMRMQPVKAFINQDHEAHLATHMAAAQDPLIQQIIGQGPNAAAIQAAMAAHVQEHVAFAYRAKMQEHLGFALPDPEATMPPEFEASISRFVAEAAGKLLQSSQATAAQQKAQQEAEDPLIQLRKAELQLKMKEIEAEAASDAERVQVDREIAHLKAQVEMAKIKAKQEEVAYSKSVDAAARREEINSRERIAAGARANQEQKTNDRN